MIVLKTFYLFYNALVIYPFAFKLNDCSMLLFYNRMGFCKHFDKQMIKSTQRSFSTSLAYELANE